MSDLIPKLDSPDDWQSGRKPDGSYHHPQVFDPANGYDGTPEGWFKLLDKYDLEILTIVAADEGFTGLTNEAKLRQLEGHSVMREWTPPYPAGHGAGWVLLVLDEDESTGLYAIYGMQAHPENVVGEAQ